MRTVYDNEIVRKGVRVGGRATANGAYIYIYICVYIYIYIYIYPTSLWAQ